MLEERQIIIENDQSAAYMLVMLVSLTTLRHDQMFFLALCCKFLPHYTYFWQFRILAHPCTGPKSQWILLQNAPKIKKNKVTCKKEKKITFRFQSLAKTISGCVSKKKRICFETLVPNKKPKKKINFLLLFFFEFLRISFLGFSFVAFPHAMNYL